MSSACRYAGQRGFFSGLSRGGTGGPIILTAMTLAPAACFGAAASANPVKSLYTTVDLKSCKQIKHHRDGGAWRCEGLPGFPVYVAEGDLRQFVSVGAAPEKRRAATQTLGPFNSIFG